MAVLNDLSNILQNRQAKRFAKSEKKRGRQIKEQAEADLRNFQRQELQNVADGQSVDFTAANFQSQGVDSTLAATLDTLQQGGGAGFGAIGGLLGQQVQARQNITADLAAQRQNIETLRAEDAKSIRGIQETREEGELAGLAQERQYGRETEDAARDQLQALRQQTFDTIENTSIFKAADEGVGSALGEYASSAGKGEGGATSKIGGLLRKGAGALSKAGATGADPSAGSGIDAKTLTSIIKLLGKAGVAASDRRLKENIRQIGHSESGIPVYLFNYKGQKGLYEGAMSDEVPEEAVIKNYNGIYDGVDYSKIDVHFRKIA